jgi:hypothetical protein
MRAMLLMNAGVIAEERQRREAAQAHEAAQRKAPDASTALNVPPPRAPAKVELNFSKSKRSMPARERIETDEEVQKRSAPHCVPACACSKCADCA